MKKDKQPTEYSTGTPTYQTGSTKPPKSHVGIVAFLLSAVIFACGISTILSLMRVNLRLKATPPAERRVAFASPPTEEVPATCPLGIQGQTLPPLWQDYRALPQGVFVTHVPAGHGLFVGDILRAVNDQPVTSWDQLLSILDQYTPGQQVSVTVYRNGTSRQIRMMIER